MQPGPRPKGIHHSPPSQKALAKGPGHGDIDEHLGEHRVPIREAHGTNAADQIGLVFLGSEPASALTRSATLGEGIDRGTPGPGESKASA